jgi:osmotically-inducible protein OsmY
MIPLSPETVRALDATFTKEKLIMRTESDIKRDVEEEIKYDADVHSSDIGVSVKSGVVALTGFVGSYSQKLHAGADAKRVTGVMGVANNIQVRKPSVDARLDPEIARDVVTQLKAELPLSYEQIKSVVKNGWVTLEGNLVWNYQHMRAESATRRVKGVIGVSNQIKLAPQVSPVEVKAEIERTEARSAQIDANPSNSKPAAVR